MVAIGVAVFWPRPEPPSGATPVGAFTVPTTEPAPTTTTTTDPRAEVPLGTTGPGTPTRAHPAKMLLIGDSEAGGLEPYLRAVLAPVGVVEVRSLDKVSSGLARPDFFNWPRQLDAVMPDMLPDIVVIMIGGNDGQPLRAADGSLVARLGPASPQAWTNEYRSRVEELIDLASIGHASVIWVGIPNSDSKDFNGRIKVINDTVREALADRPEVTFVDTHKRFATKRGGWTNAIVDPADGVRKVVRAADGFHLNPAGAKILARDVAAAVVNLLRARGADVSLNDKPTPTTG